MSNYYLDRQNIFLPATDGTKIILKLTANSGRIVYRNKINTLIGIIHPGIELGTDQFGFRWFIHHHYKNFHPTIDREDIFSQGAEIFYDDKPVSYDRLNIVERALVAWCEAKEYNWLWQNCQHFVNEITRDESTSEAIDKISDIALFLSAASGIAGLLTGNKTLINTAIGFGIAGGAAKIINTPKLNQTKKISYYNKISLI